MSTFLLIVRVPRQILYHTTHWAMKFLLSVNSDKLYGRLQFLGGWQSSIIQQVSKFTRLCWEYEISRNWGHRKQNLQNKILQCYYFITCYRLINSSCKTLLSGVIITIFWTRTYNAEGSKKLKSKYKIWVRSSVCTICSRQTVIQKDSIEALYQNRNPGSWSLASPVFSVILLPRSSMR